jgi:hypothetical protein
LDPYGYSAEWLARVCGVDESTARRWKRLSFVPGRYRHLIELADSCDLGMLSPVWAGWTLTRDELVTPDGERFQVGQVKAIPIREQLAAELESRLRRVLDGAGRRQAREIVIRVQLDEDGDLARAPRAELMEPVGADA